MSDSFKSTEGLQIMNPLRVNNIYFVDFVAPTYTIEELKQMAIDDKRRTIKALWNKVFVALSMIGSFLFIIIPLDALAIYFSDTTLMAVIIGWLDFEMIVISWYVFMGIFETDAEYIKLKPRL
jgi:hypothetical protein